MTDLDQGIRRNDDGSFTMCDTEECCPTISFGEDGSAVITDEGETVKFTPGQARLLSKLLVANQAIGR